MSAVVALVVAGGPDAAADLAAVAADLERAPLRTPLRIDPDGTVTAVTDSERLAVAVAADVARRTGLRLGIGVGGGTGGAADPAPQTDPAETVAAAIVDARRAAAEALRRPVPVAVDGPHDRRAALIDAQTALELTVLIIARRSAPGHTAVALMDRLGSRAEAAAVLGISRQALSQRLRTAGWRSETAGRRLAERLLRAAALAGQR